jgi:hypothetical protein
MDAVFYRNLIQAAWLLGKPDATLLDIFCDSGGKMVLVFPKELHKKYVPEWRDRQHESKEKNNG